MTLLEPHDQLFLKLPYPFLLSVSETEYIPSVETYLCWVLSLATERFVTLDAAELTFACLLA